MNETNTGPQAFVLAGGGAYAAYEVGVMQALVAGRSPASGFAPVDPQILTGTSAGGFNAAFLASQTQSDISQAVQSLAAVWLTRLAGDPNACSNGVMRYRLDPFTILNPLCVIGNLPQTLSNIGDDLAFLTATVGERLESFASSNGPIEDRLARSVDLSALIATKLVALIPEVISCSNIAVSPRALRIAATNWTTGVLEIFSNYDMTKEDAPLRIAASAAIPAIFQPVKIGGRTYVDGGVLMNTPLSPAIHAGAGTMHVVYMDPDLAKVPDQILGNTLDTLERIWNVQNAQDLNNDIESAARINRAVGLVQSEMKSFSSEGRHVAAQVAGRILGNTKRLSPQAAEAHFQRYRPLTIHRYHPHDDLGSFLGLLRFDRPSIERLMQKGYQDAIAHNCQTEGCINGSGLVEWPAMTTEAATKV